MDISAYNRRTRQHAELLLAVFRRRDAGVLESLTRNVGGDVAPLLEVLGMKVRVIENPAPGCSVAAAATIARRRSASCVPAEAGCVSPLCTKRDISSATTTTPSKTPWTRTPRRPTDKSRRTRVMPSPRCSCSPMSTSTRPLPATGRPHAASLTSSPQVERRRRLVRSPSPSDSPHPATPSSSTVTDAPASPPDRATRSRSDAAPTRPQATCAPSSAPLRRSATEGPGVRLGREHSRALPRRVYTRRAGARRRLRERPGLASAADTRSA